MESSTIISMSTPGSPSKKAPFGSSMAVDRSAAMGVDTPPPSSPLATSRTATAAHPALTSSSPVKPSQASRRSIVDSTLDLLSCDPLAGLRALAFPEPVVAAPFTSSADPNAISATQVSHIIYGSYTHSLLIGRSKPSGLPHSTTTPDSILPPSSSQGLGSKPSHHVILPNTAKHVSRLHATIQWVPALPASTPSSRDQDAAAPVISTGAFVVRILGQNGLIVDGKRRREGHVLRLTPGKTVLDFFGLAARFDVHPDAVAPLPAPATSGASARKNKHNGKSAVTPRASLGASPSKKARRSLASTLGAALSSSGGRTIKMPLSPTSSSPPPAALASSSPSMRKVQGVRKSATLKRSRESSAEDQEDEKEEDEEIAARADSPSLRRRARGARDQLRAGPRVLSKDDAMDESEVSDEESESEAESESESESEEDSQEDEEEDSEAQLSDSSSLTPEPEAAIDNQEKSRVGRRAASKSKVPSSSSPKSSSASTASAAPKRQATRRSNRSSHQRSSSAALMPPRSTSGGSGRNTPVTSSSPSEGQTAILQALARQCVADLAPSYDLQGLLAGAIVFHRTATISASEAVRSVLASTPTLMNGEAGTMPMVGSISVDGENTPSEKLQPGQRHPLWGAPSLLGPLGPDGSTSQRWESIARKAWREKLEMVLQLGSCFGIIQRAGKDSSGHDLECWYYYDREGDEDAERAANLGALAKPMRAALKTHKPIFWKKAAYGHGQSTTTASNMAPQASQLVTESQLGSSSPALPLPIAAIQAGILSSSSATAASSIRPASTLASSSSTAAHSAAQIQTSSSTLPSNSTSTPSPISSTTAIPPNNNVLKERKALPNAALERIWDETQPEEREKSWDPKGDADFLAGAAGGKRRK